MCTRPFRPRPRRDPRRKGPRPRRDRDVGHFVPDETETETLRVRDETLAETCGEKNKHHKINWTSKHFVFVMLWDFAARALCALRGIAAVRPSVCSPSVTLRYRGHVSWATSKIITLRSSLLGAPTSASYSLRGTPKNSGLTGVGCCFQQKTCISAGRSTNSPHLLVEVAQEGVGVVVRRCDDIGRSLVALQ